MSAEINHSTRLYFPYTFDSGAKISDFVNFSRHLSSLTVSSLFLNAAYLDDKSHGLFLKSKLWEKTNYKLENRIHDVADKLINGIHDASNCDGFFGLHPYKLSSDAIRILNQGSKQDIGQGVSVPLKATSLKRLSEKGINAPIENNRWPLMFNNVWFYGFNTGVGMMVIDISYKQPKKNGIALTSLEELQELNYMIARSVIKRKSAESIWGENENSKGIVELVSALLPLSKGQSINLQPTKDHGNAYTYTSIATDQKLSYTDRKTYLFRITRKYTDMYLPENIDEHIEYFEPFKPITHAFCLEGAASFIDYTSYDDNVPQTISNFTNDTIPKAYAPMVLLTYAEYIFLREMSANSSDSDKVDMLNPTNNNLSKLRKFKAKLYGFRMNFEFVQISGNTNHNLFYKANKKSLEVDKLLNKLSCDTQEIEQYISDYVSQKQASRFRKFGIMASLFAVIIGWIDLWGLNLHKVFFGTVPINQLSLKIFLSVLIVLGILVVIMNMPPKDKKKN